MRVISRSIELSSAPPLHAQLTLLDKSALLWVGSSSATTRLADAWACAMPPTANGRPASATSLFRSSHSDAAPSLASRLSRRFKRQVFVSLDLGSLGLHADSVLPVLEREVVVWLAGVLTPAS